MPRRRQRSVDSAPRTTPAGYLSISESAARALAGYAAILICAIPRGTRPGIDADPVRYSVSGPLPADPGWWGILLHDLVQHVANSYAHEGMDPVAAQRRVWEILDAERADPTGRSHFDGADGAGREN